MSFDKVDRFKLHLLDFAQARLDADLVALRDI